jgi:PKD repeat protein
MKTLNNICIVLIVVGLCFSCKKKNYPESVFENEAVFYFKGTINNTPISLGAGVDDYYMQSTYQQDSLGVYNFIGNLGKQNCDNCPNTLQIKINDFKVSALNAPTKIDSALQARNYSVLSGIDTSYSVQFNAIYNKTASVYNWDFGDGFTSTLANPTHIYNKRGNYKACLNIKGTNNCYGSICNEQKIGLNGNPCKTVVNSSYITSNNIQFTQNTSGTTPLSYLWDFGDGNKSTLANPSHSYAISGSYRVILKVTDGNNDLALANYNVLTQNDVSSCTTNYNVASITPIITQQTRLALSKVTITWIDGNGITYTSNNSLQPSSSYFEILSVEDYENNENNQKTKKIKIKFKSTVYNGINALSIDNAETVICIAYN